MSVNEWTGNSRWTDPTVHRRALPRATAPAPARAPARARARAHPHVQLIAQLYDLEMEHLRSQGRPGGGGCKS